MTGRKVATTQGGLIRAARGRAGVTAKGRGTGTALLREAKAQAGRGGGFARNRHGKARIGFIVDATGSRGAGWEAAQTVQAGMFRAVSGLGTLSLRLIHFGGNRSTDHGWLDDPRLVASQMAEVRCAAGLTRHLPALQSLLGSDTMPGSIIMVGDCFEESRTGARALAKELKAGGIRVFAFLEGDDSTADAVFRELADTTGGAFAGLGDELPLGELCKGVAVMTAGGREAVSRLEHGGVKRLLLGDQR